MKSIQSAAASILLLVSVPVFPQSTGDDIPPNSACCQTVGDDATLATEIILTGLDQPWAMAFLPDGEILITERSGNLRLFADDRLSPPIAGLPEIAAIGQGGLLDVALDPAFSDNGLIYFSYAEPDVEGYGTAVSRGLLDVEELTLRDVERIFTSNRKSGGGRHFGSRLRFANDDTLFITLGDRGSQPRAQDPFDHAGSVVRINRDGSIPADNPFADGVAALPEIWSTGHRNPQGAALVGEENQLWTLSHGAKGGDEVNWAQAGRNYGWPTISYGTNYSGSGFKQGTRAEGLEQPVYFWDPSIAPSGFTYYRPDNPAIPAWSGSLLAGALKAGYLSRLIMDGDSIVAEERYLEGRFGRIRDVRTGPDGAVWLLTDSNNGILIRVTANQ